MTNISNIINMHNKKIIKKNQQIEDKTKTCNCKKFECPLKNDRFSCRTKSVIYEAAVKTKNNNETRTYIGLTANEFKTRWYQHRHDFSNKNKMDSTELSKYIWNLKNNNIKFELKWRIIRKVTEMKNGNQMCRLCLTEANMIIKNKTGLNKRNEIFNKCRHQNKFLLKNWKAKDKKN